MNLDRRKKAPPWIRRFTKRLSAAITIALILILLTEGRSRAMPASRVGDVDGDGRITAVDALLALEDALGLRTLPDDRRVVAALGGKLPTRTGAAAILRAALGVGALPWICGVDYIENCAFLPDGSLVFGDFNGGNIRHVAADGTVSTFVKTGGSPNAILSRSDGHLIVAVADYTTNGGRVLDVAPDGSMMTELAKTMPRQPIGNPHHLLYGPGGVLYFTGESLGDAYMLRPDGTVDRITQGIKFATGIDIGSDGHLVIADEQAGKIWDYPLGPDGLPMARKLWAQMPGPNGIHLDKLGRLWATSFADGRIYVFAPDGTLLRKINPRLNMLVNLTFGPPGSRAIYVTTANPGCVGILRLATDDPLAAGLP